MRPRRAHPVLGLGLVLLVVGSSQGAADGQVPEQRTIAIELIAPPSIEGALRAGLWSGDVEITDTYCEPAPLETSQSGGPVLRCDDLPDGFNYRVGLVEPIPAEVLTAVTCGDALGTTTQTPQIPWASPLNGWVCDLWASSPAVLLDADAPLLLADDRPAPIDLVLRDGAGNTLSSECEPDEVYGRTQRWCSGLAVGEYSAELIPPMGYRGSMACGDVGAGGADGAGGPGAIVLTEQAPIWNCFVDYLAAPLSADIRIWDPLAPSWTDGLELVAVREDGLDVSDSCSVIGIVEIPADPRIPSPTHAGRADCPGVPNGIYRLTLGGVPDVVDISAIGVEPDVTTACLAEVTDALEGICIFELSAERAVPPDTTQPPAPTTSTVGSSAVLPRTGSPRIGILVPAVATLMAGAALFAITRRPTYRTSGDGTMAAAAHQSRSGSDHAQQPSGAHTAQPHRSRKT